MPTRGDHTVLLALLAVFVFHSPFSRWWANLELAWHTIFILWGLVILLVALNQRGDRSDGR